MVFAVIFFRFRSFRVGIFNRADEFGFMRQFGGCIEILRKWFVEIFESD